MNVFYLDREAGIAARYHCDKHVVKMIVEYAQLLSTAHRVLDGIMLTVEVNGRRRKVWSLPDSESPLYAASHINHPDAVWVREASGNYFYLFMLWLKLCEEYEARYGRVHATFTKLHAHLPSFPKNIPFGPFTEPPKCMPDEFKVDDVVTSYHNYYVGAKARFARWTNTRPPQWFINRIPAYDEANFERTRRVADRTTEGR